MFFALFERDFHVGCWMKYFSFDSHQWHSPNLTLERLDCVFNDVSFLSTMQKSPYVNTREWNEDDRRTFFIKTGRSVRICFFEDRWRFPRLNVVNIPFFTPFHWLQIFITNPESSIKFLLTSRSIFSAFSGFHWRALNQRNKKWSSCSGLKISDTDRRNCGRERERQDERSED